MIPFTHRTYEKILRRLIEDNYRFTTLSHSEQLEGKIALLKHDVETKVKKSVAIAKLECDLGVVSTYYVQGYLLLNDRNLRFLRQIQSYGHEVAYHYDVLDNNQGDWHAAAEEFKYYLGLFKMNGFTVDHVCQHGNPLTTRVGYTSNRDFLRNNENKREFGVIDFMLHTSDLLNRDVRFYSDYGYSFKHIKHFEKSDKSRPQEENFDELNCFFASWGESIAISTHTHRWIKSEIVFRFRLQLWSSLRKVYIGLRLEQMFPIITAKLARRL